LEQLFPFLRIRFISVCDGYDSERDGSAAGNIDFAFRNLLNDYYSKDLSAKCKAGIAAMHAAGKYHSGITPYGYMKPDGDIHRLVPDETAAATVRRVFAEILAGRRPSEIAKALNADDIPTPAKYKSMTGAPKRGFRTDSVWTGYTVGRILRDIRYTGVLVQGMHKSMVVGSKQSRRLPESEWKVSPIMHEAVVSDEDFKAVSALIESRNKRSFSKGNRHMLAGKVFCAGCGHSMILSSKKSRPAFYCSYKPYNGCELCAGGIRVSVIESAVIEAAVNLKYATKQDESARGSALPGRNNRRHILGKINTLQKNKLALYAEYADGKTEKRAYLSQRDAIDADISALQSEYDAIGNVFASERAKGADAMLSALKELRDGGTLTREIADALIDRIIVNNRKELEIKWRFENGVSGNGEDCGIRPGVLPALCGTGESIYNEPAATFA
jgi:hypothetical protein